MTPISSKRIAVFPGTFDPFTLGHMSIVSRGLELLDEVVIAIGINDSKRTYFTVEQRLEMLRDLFRDKPRIRVVSYDSLTIDLAKQWNARFILRHIQKSLVQRNGLDDIRIFMKDFVYLAGNGFVDFHPSRDKDKLGAQPLCLQ